MTHPAQLLPEPKEYRCPICQHDTVTHREHGCDVGTDDGGICGCSAPYGRVMPGDPAPMANRDHVVVTFYRKDLLSSPIMHVYGMYTTAEAKRERKKILDGSPDEASAGLLHVSACKIIDIDAMNADSLKNYGDYGTTLNLD
jgi:hypothetical protein